MSDPTDGHERVSKALEDFETARKQAEAVRERHRREHRAANDALREAKDELKDARAAASADLVEARTHAQWLSNTYDWTTYVESPGFDELWDDDDGASRPAGIRIHMGGECVALLYAMEDGQPVELANAICEAGGIILALASEVERLRAAVAAGGGGDV